MHGYLINNNSRLMFKTQRTITAWRSFLLFSLAHNCAALNGYAQFSTHLCSVKVDKIPRMRFLGSSTPRMHLWLGKLHPDPDGRAFSAPYPLEPHTVLGCWHRYPALRYSVFGQKYFFGTLCQKFASFCPPPQSFKRHHWWYRLTEHNLTVLLVFFLVSETIISEQRVVRK